VVVSVPRGQQRHRGPTATRATTALLNRGGVRVRAQCRGWSQQAYLKAPSTGTGDEFGFSVAVSGHTVVVGLSVSPTTPPGSTATEATTALLVRAAYVFLRNAGVEPAGLPEASNTGVGDQFGFLWRCRDTVVVGAVSESSNATRSRQPGDNTAGSSGAARSAARAGTVLHDHLSTAVPSHGGA
jgi:hypothetical protein